MPCSRFGGWLSQFDLVDSLSKDVRPYCDRGNAVEGKTTFNTIPNAKTASRSVGVKTIEQAVAARSLKILLAASCASVSRIPRQHVPFLAKPDPVVMSDNGGTFAIRSPRVASRIAPGSGIKTVGVRAQCH